MSNSFSSDDNSKTIPPGNDSNIIGIMLRKNNAIKFNIFQRLSPDDRKTLYSRSQNEKLWDDNAYWVPSKYGSLVESFLELEKIKFEKHELHHHYFDMSAEGKKAFLREKQEERNFEAVLERYDYIRLLLHDYNQIYGESLLFAHLIIMTPEDVEKINNEKQKNHLKLILNEGEKTEQFSKENKEKCVKLYGEASKEVVKKDEHKPNFEPFNEMQMLTMPPKEWLIDQILGPKDLGMIYGAPGCGKTFVVLDLIISACLGLPWANNSFKINKPLRVAYCAGEGFSGLPGRLQTAMKKYGVDSLNGNFTFYKSVPQLFQESKDILESMEVFTIERKNPLDLLIVDTMHAATVGADENSAKDMGAAIKKCRYAAEKMGCAILLVHHMNKIANSERGSSALRGAMDMMIQLTSGDPISKMDCTKSKDGEKWNNKGFLLCKPNQELYFPSVCVSWENLPTTEKNIGKEQQIKDKILTYLRTSEDDDGFTAKQIEQVINENNGTTRKILKKLVDEGQCKSKAMDTEKETSKSNPLLYFL